MTRTRIGRSLATCPVGTLDRPGTVQICGGFPSLTVMKRPTEKTAGWLSDRSPTGRFPEGKRAHVQGAIASCDETHRTADR
jgi:hypothetical protein